MTAIAKVRLCIFCLQILLASCQSVLNDSSTSTVNYSNSTFLSTTPAKHLNDSEGNQQSPAEDFDGDENDDFVHDIDALESYLGGPLEGRKFVTVSQTRLTAKIREKEYTFRTNARSKRDSVKELEEGKKNDVLDQETIKKILQAPKGFSTTTVYYHYSHALTALERIQETEATLGVDCEPKSIIDFDYCERAKYPNKNKMVCNTVNAPKYKCICKYYKNGSKDQLDWVQMRHGPLTLEDGKDVEACLVPEFGVCEHRLPVGIKDIHGSMVYEVDVCKGHFQCDNTEFYKDLVQGKRLKVVNHCTVADFLGNFHKKVRHKVRICAKPHPRRFGDYDEYKYYCLNEESRDPEPWQFQKPDVEEEDEDKDVFFDEDDE